MATSPQQQHYDILIAGGDWNDTPIQASSIEEATHYLQEWIINQSQDDKQVIFALTVSYHCETVGWYLQVKAWNPDVYQGRPFPTKTISYVPSLVSFKESEWIRGKASGRMESINQRFEEWIHDRNSDGFITQAFDAIFQALMKAQTPRILVETLGHPMALQQFVANVPYNKNLQRIEFDLPQKEEIDRALTSLDFLSETLQEDYLHLSEEQQKLFDKEWLPRLNANRNAQLCTQLLKMQNKPRSWTELVFLNLGACSKKSIQKLLGAVRYYETLESLDLRANRRIHTWDKHMKRYQGPKNPKICIDPLVHGRTKNMNNNKALKKLDLSGNKLSSDDSMGDFIASLLLQHQSLKTLMLRDTFLDGTAIKAIIHALSKHDNINSVSGGLQELDLSHNGPPLTRRGVIQSFCEALKTDKALQTLKLEHCGLRLAHLNVLAEALPEMGSLQHLCLNGNNDDDGPGLLVDALECNHSLLTLEVGSLNPRSIRSCATPSYTLCSLDDGKLAKLQEFLTRNEEAQDEMMQQKVELLKMDKSPLQSKSSCLVDWKMSTAQAVAA